MTSNERHLLGSLCAESDGTRPPQRHDLVLLELGKIKLKKKHNEKEKISMRTFKCNNEKKITIKKEIVIIHTILTDNQDVHVDNKV